MSKNNFALCHSLEEREIATVNQQEQIAPPQKRWPQKQSVFERVVKLLKPKKSEVRNYDCFTKIEKELFALELLREFEKVHLRA